MALALFDLDNTLIHGDSDSAWGDFLVQKNLCDEAFRAQNSRYHQEYEQGILNINDYLDFILAPLTQLSLEEFADLHNEFMDEVVAPMMLPKAKTLLLSHRKKGDTLVIITATNTAVTAPIAVNLQVDCLLGTDVEVKEGRFTGHCLGTPCFREGKVKKIQQWLAQNPKHSLEGSYFYSDSINDLSLLELVDNPVVVHPDAALKEQALTRNWPILSLI